MSNPVKLGLTILGAILVGYIAWLVLKALVSAAISLIIPIGVVVAIALIIYGLVSRKSLGGGNKPWLP